jgi:flavin-dependent dehydrogenase
MTRNTEHDIIIVGAGPIGSYTAFLLAREGFDVGIFEKNPSIGKDVNCSGIVSVECFKRFGLPAGYKKDGFDWHKDIISYLISHLMPGNIFKK